MSSESCFREVVLGVLSFFLSCVGVVVMGMLAFAMGDYGGPKREVLPMLFAMTAPQGILWTLIAASLISSGWRLSATGLGALAAAPFLVVMVLCLPEGQWQGMIFWGSWAAFLFLAYSVFTLIWRAQSRRASASEEKS